MKIAQEPLSSKNDKLRFSENLILKNVSLLKTLDRKNLDDFKVNINSILRWAPLNDDALVHYSILYLQKGEISEGLKLLKAAKDRNARNRTTLNLLLKQHLNKWDIEQALDEINLLYVLDKRNRAIYDQILLYIFESDGGTGNIIEALKKNPAWAYHFLKKQISVLNADKLAILKPAVINFTHSNKKWVNTIKTSYLKRLVNLDMIEESYSIWYGMLKINERRMISSESLNFNTNFEALDALAPFNWNNRTNKSVTIETDSQGGIYISYAGQRPAIITSQYFKSGLSKFSEISFDARVLSSKIGGKYELRIFCPQKKIYISTITISEETSLVKHSIYNSDVIPSDCPFLDLQIWARPSNYGKRISAIIRHLDVSEVRV